MAQMADVVIVGAGSAGCVLAARQSEDPSLRVVLLEAGPDYPDLATLPEELLNGWRPAYTHDWGYASEPGEALASVPLPRARVVGGCSATNASIDLRGAVEDYDRWAALGNPGWSFNEVLPAFCRLEHDLDFADAAGHGADGPLPIRRYPDEEIDPVQRAFLEAAVSVGDAPVEDHNRPGAVGVGKIPANAIDGQRISNARTYLAAARGRPNLEVRPRVLVDRVMVRDGSATGVRLAEPAATLEAGLVILATVATWRSNLAPADEPYDMHLFCNGPFEADPGSGGLAGAPPPEMWGALVVGVMRPRSRGRVRLRSTNPEDPPGLHLAHLEHPEDLARIVEGVRRARSVLRTDPLAGRVIGADLPPWGELDEEDQAGLERVARAVVGTYHHPVGTCRMGPNPQAGAVVDAACRAHGIERLMVVDASVMPEIPASNTNVPTTMIAEQVSAWLR